MRNYPGVSERSKLNPLAKRTGGWRFFSMDSLSFLFLLGTKYLCFRPGARIQRPTSCITGSPLQPTEYLKYVEAMENTPLLRARGLDNKFHLLADFGGAVLAGRERGTGRGYEFVTWIWDYERVGVSHGHYYEDDFAGAKRDFAVRSGLIPKASLFSNEELTEIYRATDHLLAEDPNLNDKQIRAIQEARIKIEFSVPDLDTQLEHRQDYSPQMEM